MKNGNKAVSIIINTTALWDQCKMGKDEQMEIKKMKRGLSIRNVSRYYGGD